MDFKKRGLKPRIALRWLFPSKIPTILGPRIMKSDFLDYINAFILLILLRVAKLKIFWRLYFLFPSKFVALINKPINFLQKRYNLLQRILKKSKLMFKILSILLIIKDKLKQRGLKGFFVRSLIIIWELFSSDFDEYIFNFFFF